MREPTHQAPGSARAAVLIDYQNLYYYLKNRLEGHASPGDHILDMIDALRQRLVEQEAPIAVGRAYADFAGLDDHARHVQRALYLLGIDPCFVPSTMHRNTTDLQLCIDALDLVQDRRDIATVVLVSGDRDYVPLVQAIQRRGCEVIMVSFREHLSARLFENVDAGRFIDAETLMTEDARTLLQEDHHANGQPETTTEFAEVTDLPFPIDVEALRVIEDYFGQYDEVYLTPLLRKLSEELGDIEDHDPKSLIGDLEDCGACRLERRKGMPYDYTVLIVNPEHPAVREVQNEMRADYDDEDEYESNGDGADYEGEFGDLATEEE
ncbi:MAG: NYN domain-containing protein [Rhodothermales bacterium]